MLRCSFDLERKWNLPLIVGVDEAGRGCLAGPVVAAAVVFSEEIRFQFGDEQLNAIDDSKKLKPKVRTELASYIKEHSLAWAIAQVEAAEIDRINILQATFRAARMAVEQVQEVLGKTPDLILMDGNHPIPQLDLKQQAVIQGDSISKSIAAASVLAKAHRDELMDHYEREYPGYQFGRHKGYGTEIHREALRTLGMSPIHRKSFLRNREKLDFGRSGEELAVAFLKERNFKILHRNFKLKVGEIDIVAENDSGIHFIEVRSRSRFSELAQVFPPSKQAQVSRVAEAFQSLHVEKRDLPCHVDLLCVGGTDIEPFWDVFAP